MTGPAEQKEKSAPAAHARRGNRAVALQGGAEGITLVRFAVFLSHEMSVSMDSPSPALLRNLGNVSIIGLQWGDEGKGKIIDLLSSEFDYAVRWNGGSNAGHKVEVGANKYRFHLIPIGILRPNVTCVICPGVV